VNTTVKRYGVRGLFALLLICAAFALQGPAPIPPYEGDGNPSHDGQPQWCQNVDSPANKGNCDCMDMADDQCDKAGRNTSKCKVWCRPSSCKCRTKCDRQTR